jgi:hypothetical protein
MTGIIDYGSFFSTTVPEFIDPVFAKNKLKTLVVNQGKQAFWACFREK